jgi:hypothetical protein
MSEGVLRALAEVGPQVRWVVAFFAGAVAARTLYLGIAMIAAIRAKDESSREARYRIFRDLVELFRRGGKK